MNAENRSEVARLRREIAANYEAGQRALNDLAAGTARHDFITARMERMGQDVEDLTQVVGSKEEAMAIMADVLALLPEGGSGHAPQL